MTQPLSLNTLVVRGGQKWRIGAVMLTSGDRYYQLVSTTDDNDVALLPWFEVEPWAIVTPRVR